MNQLNPSVAEPINILFQDALCSAPALECPAGVRLFQQGSRAQDAYLIVSGITKLACTNQSGREVIVGLRGPGSLLGTAAIVLSRPHPVTAATLTPCSVKRITSDDFQNLFSVNTIFCRYLHEVHAQEVHSLMDLLVDTVSQSAQDRLAKLLSGIASEIQPFGPRKKQGVSIPLRRWEIAELLSITPEHLSRLLRRLERAGLILQEGKLLFIPDAKRLLSFRGPRDRSMNSKAN